VEGVVNKMSKLKLYICTVSCTIASVLTANLGLLFCPSLSLARPDVYGREIRYGSCAQLQKRMNNVDNQIGIKYRGFEKSNLTVKTLIDNGYFVYCNGGTIIDNEQKTICRGYIGYGYSPKMGIAQYAGDWGQTDGTPNGDDTDKGKYCRRIR
jgi:hypothetical protein